MIIPYAHEEQRGRRWPLVTIGLIVLNVACFLAYGLATHLQVEQIESRVAAAVEFRAAHPAVVDDCAPLARLARRPARPGSERSVGAAVPEDQAQYESLCSGVSRDIADLPLYTFGYVPAKNDAIALFTYQFVHGGWLHLLSNMWFLWLCGVNIEDRWGRALYLGFYLAAGVAAALAEKLASPSSMTPIVGASGAIAGAMGAFLVLYARTRIRFAYAFFIVRWGTFSAPAIVMLPLWLATEVLMGLLPASGVAHWAHVGGFVFGTAVAVTFRATGLDAKLDAAVDRTVTVAQDPRILRAGELIDAGSPREATAILATVAREKPRSIDAQLELLRAAKRANDLEGQRPIYAKLVELYFDGRMPDTAADLYAEMAALGLHDRLARGWSLQVAENLASRALTYHAEVAYDAASREGLVDAVAVRAALAHARVLRRMGRVEHARERLVAARHCPFVNAAMSAAIDAELSQIA